MQLQVRHIPNSPLGAVVELRELTMDAFMAVQRENKDISEEDTLGTSMNYLAHMLYIDGQPVTRAQLGGYPMTAVMALFKDLNELLGGDIDVGED
jgi:hypothetical protein